jgi:hypothetical protein
MTRTTNARVAGFTFLFYIAAGIASLALSGRPHATDVLSLFTSLSALVLGVTLYGITREQDPDLAMLALICRVVEGLNGVAGISGTLRLLWLATATGANAPDIEATHALGAFLLNGGGAGPIFFAVGSTLFSWLFLRGRMVPVALAWLGVLASILLVVITPLQTAGLFGGSGSWGSSVTWLMWLPMLVFEVTLALWLLIKGVAAPATR